MGMEVKHNTLARGDGTMATIGCDGVDARTVTDEELIAGAADWHLHIQTDTLLMVEALRGPVSNAVLAAWADALDRYDVTAPRDASDTDWRPIYRALWARAEQYVTHRTPPQPTYDYDPRADARMPSRGVRDDWA